MMGMQPPPALDEEEVNSGAEREEHDGKPAAQTDEREKAGAAVVPVTRHDVGWNRDQQFEDAAFPK